MAEQGGTFQMGLCSCCDEPAVCCCVLCCDCCPISVIGVKVGQPKAGQVVLAVSIIIGVFNIISRVVEDPQLAQTLSALGNLLNFCVFVYVLSTVYQALCAKYNMINVRNERSALHSVKSKRLEGTNRIRVLRIVILGMVTMTSTACPATCDGRLHENRWSGQCTQCVSVHGRCGGDLPLRIDDDYCNGGTFCNMCATATTPATTSSDTTRSPGRRRLQGSGVRYTFFAQNEACSDSTLIWYDYGNDRSGALYNRASCEARCTQNSACRFYMWKSDDGRVQTRYHCNIYSGWCSVRHNYQDRSGDTVNIYRKGAVNCAVSNWGGWTSCSESCGGGTQSRTRAVTRQAANGGSACPTLRETRNCNTLACPTTTTPTTSPNTTPTTTGRYPPMDVKSMSVGVKSSKEISATNRTPTPLVPFSAWVLGTVISSTVAFYIFGGGNHQQEHQQQQSEASDHMQESEASPKKVDNIPGKVQTEDGGSKDVTVQIDDQISYPLASKDDEDKCDEAQKDKVTDDGIVEESCCCKSILIKIYWLWSLSSIIYTFGSDWILVSKFTGYQSYCLIMINSPNTQQFFAILGVLFANGSLTITEDCAWPMVSTHLELSGEKGFQTILLGILSIHLLQLLPIMVSHLFIGLVVYFPLLVIALLAVFVFLFFLLILLFICSYSDEDLFSDAGAWGVLKEVYFPTMTIGTATPLLIIVLVELMIMTYDGKDGYIDRVVYVLLHERTYEQYFIKMHEQGVDAYLRFLLYLTI